MEVVGDVGMVASTAQLLGEDGHSYELVRRLEAWVDAWLGDNQSCLFNTTGKKS
jgi:hypothetical protein